METAFSSWISSQLQQIMEVGSDDIESITSYLTSMTQVNDVTGFVEVLVSGCPDGRFKKLRTTRATFMKQVQDQYLRFGSPSLTIPDNVTVYKKGDDVGSWADAPAPPPTKEKKGKKKTNYVSLYGKDGELHSKAVMLPGRHTCECQAQKHKLISNCLGCGRVVCDQEGSGPCLFCGKLVCTREEREILSRNSKKSEKLHDKLMNVPGARVNDEKSAVALEKALEYKQRLLGYDRSHKRQTKVIDDESDYYSVESNIWLNDKERKVLKEKQDQLHEQRHGSRRNKKFMLDFAGRQILEDRGEVMNYDPTQDSAVMAANFGTLSGNDEGSRERIVEAKDLESFPDLVQPCNENLSVKYVEVGDKPKVNNSGARKEKKETNKRLQDEDLLILSDHGLCLSMHQPWASLLVHGVKMDEGRGWYSHHRGRLWIASTSKAPTQDEIDMIVDDHVQHLTSIGEATNIDLPKTYPHGCLLGYVDVKEVLDQDEYRSKYPTGMSHSPFVFVCQNPHELMLKIPVKGQHKIWKLEPSLHKAVKKAVHM